ncbi:MAG: hypothetical protein IJX36_04125 [Thermoguttaceae bacterium]|nr:hypothetical protein [Thermoguttaceae bacterium]MBQ8363102.1 hypothetical protein [Thermoguttaceae bacterium]MBQ9126885.1 hypothetical protein [Thermoguttaceae bacterium]
MDGWRRYGFAVWAKIVRRRFFDALTAAVRRSLGRRAVREAFATAFDGTTRVSQEPRI